MSQIEDSNHEDDFSAENFRIDEELKEIESQLEADARHLASLYPPMNSSRLEQLVDQCLLAASRGSEEHESAEATTDIETETTPNSEVEPSLSPVRTKKWYQFSMELCVTLMLLVSFTILWQQPGLRRLDQPAVSQWSESDNDSSPSISVSTMPPELLNASQPELEAIYDEMGYLSMSVEF